MNSDVSVWQPFPRTVMRKDRNRHAHLETRTTTSGLSFSSGDQTVGNPRLYRAACIILSVLCLVLLVVIIVLSMKGECLQPWNWIHLEVRTIAVWMMILTPNESLEGLLVISSTAEIKGNTSESHFSSSVFLAAAMSDRGILGISGLQPFFSPLTTPPTLLWFLVPADGSTVCSDAGESMRSSACSLNECQTRFNNFQSRSELHAGCKQCSLETEPKKLSL